MCGWTASKKKHKESKETENRKQKTERTNRYNHNKSTNKQLLCVWIIFAASLAFSFLQQQKNSKFSHCVEKERNKTNQNKCNKPYFSFFRLFLRLFGTFFLQLFNVLLLTWWEWFGGRRRGTRRNNRSAAVAKTRTARGCCRELLFTRLCAREMNEGRDGGRARRERFCGKLWAAAS